jgi:hypothetical protein
LGLGLFNALEDRQIVLNNGLTYQVICFERVTGKPSLPSPDKIFTTWIAISILPNRTFHYANQSNLVNCLKRLELEGMLARKALDKKKRLGFPDRE